jgi:hypothetical protein
MMHGALVLCGPTVLVGIGPTKVKSVAAMAVPATRANAPAAARCRKVLGSISIPLAVPVGCLYLFGLLVNKSNRHSSLTMQRACQSIKNLVKQRVNELFHVVS